MSLQMSVQSLAMLLHLLPVQVLHRVPGVLRGGDRAGGQRSGARGAAGAPLAAGAPARLHSRL